MKMCKEAVHFYKLVAQGDWDAVTEILIDGAKQDYERFKWLSGLAKQHNMPHFEQFYDSLAEHEHAIHESLKHKTSEVYNKSIT